MSDPSPKLASKTTRPVPMAKPALPGVVLAPPGEDEIDEPSRSPWEFHGWAWSILGHSILLLIMGLWFFGSKPSQVRTFDTKLAGSEFGVDEGLTALGGLDTPISMPEPLPMAPRPEATFARLKTSEIAPNPLAGFQGNTGNPGAGRGDGFGLAKFGNGGENIQGVAVRVGDPQFTLIWDSRADMDLHVIEPGGKEIYWNDPKGKFGGELDVDNVEGFGPENIYWLKRNENGSRDLGPGPPGEYKWYVHYYGGNRGVAAPTRWKVRIKHEGRVEVIQDRLTVPGSKTKPYTLIVKGQPISEEGKFPEFRPLSAP
ncbi:YfaP family protein [Tundrisphaera lichenicola]|uniref:YfaP family protein n=1 Tax=Tundrisphaera lichenicola TaxID=2029860 RepID=UPI003EBE58EF